MFVIVHNNSVVLGPMPWRKRFFESTLADDLEIEVSLPSSNEGVYIVDANTKIMPAVYTEEPITSYTKKLDGPFWTFTETLATGSFVAVDKNIEHMRSDLKQLVADIRWSKETGGIKVAFGGVDYSIDTSRDGRNIFMQAAQLGANTTWKFNEGWVALTVADLQTIVQAVFTHVQLCFAEEAALVAQIEAATSIDQLATIHQTLTSKE